MHITNLTTMHPTTTAASGPATLDDVFRIAIDETEGKARTDTSTQNDEWRRAGLEAKAALGPQRRVSALSAADGKVLAQSALLRIAANATVEDWDTLLAPRRAALPTHKPLLDINDLVAAFHEARGPKPEPLTDQLRGRRWCELVIHNVRAQLKYVQAYAPDRFIGADRFTIAEDLTVLLSDVARRIGATLRVAVNRTRPPITKAQDIMRRLMDPRLRLYFLLSASCNADGARRVRRSHLDPQPERGRYRIAKTKRDGSVVGGYSYVVGDSAAYLESALAAVYAPFEARWLADGEDYALFFGYEWDGLQLVPCGDGALLRMDPRLWLLLVLGIEGRLEQQHRLTYRMLQRVEDGSMCLRSPGIATKQASDLPLCAAQVDALGFACTFGHLAPLMRAYDATQERRRAAAEAAARQERLKQAVQEGETSEATKANEATKGSVLPADTTPVLDVDDFPLCPAGKLDGGQALVIAASLQPTDDRTLWDWNEPVLRALGIKEEGTSLRTWRRLFVDLYKEWKVDAAVHGLITGHSAIISAGTVTNTTTGTREDTLTQVYFDARAAHLLAPASAVMEHVRTRYVVDGTPFPPC